MGLLDACEIDVTQVRDHQDSIVLYQWGSGAVLNNTNYYIQGVDPVSGGIIDNDFTKNLFYKVPEFGIYL